MSDRRQEEGGAGAARGLTGEDWEVWRIVEDHYDALNAHDMDAYARVFTPDADFVTVSGASQRGIGEIVEGHRQVWAAHYRDSHVSVVPVSIRYLRPDVAVVRMNTEIVYGSGQERRTATPMMVLVKEPTGWVITAVQNTLVSGPSVIPVGNRP
jgi:uncharacterized protein (TIGR02246 family)